MRPSISLLFAVVLAAAPAAGLGQSLADAAVTDPAPDPDHPTRNRQLLVPSHGVGMNGLFLLASGAGAKPTVVLLHGLPGNERNLDLAQAVRRAGWNVLTFTYRGAWGSPGEFSIAHAIEDAAAAVDFLHQPEVAARYAVDPARIVLAGHSTGAFAAAQVAAQRDDLAGVLLIDAWNVGDEARRVRNAPEAYAALVAGFDDLGHSLVGATAESLAQEVRDSPASWDLPSLAPKLATQRVQVIWADRGIAEHNVALVEALREAGATRLATAHFPTDHAFSDHRIALSRTVVAWLQALPGPDDAVPAE